MELNLNQASLELIESINHGLEICVVNLLALHLLGSPLLEISLVGIGLNSWLSIMLCSLVIGAL